MKLKLIASVLVLMVALTGILGATAAYFSDTEQSTTTVAAGTLDLTIGNGGITIPATVENMAPGQTREVLVTKLKNVGTIDGYLYFDEMLITDLENGLTEPEIEAGDETSEIGELSSKLSYTVKFYKSIATVLGQSDLDYSSMTSNDLISIVTLGCDDLRNWRQLATAPQLKANHYCYAVIEIEWSPTNTDNLAQSDIAIINGVFELLQTPTLSNPA